MGWNFCTFMTRGTSTQLAYVLIPKKCKESYIYFLFFYLMLVRYLPGLGISEIRDLFFRGPIWIRLKNSGSFCVGQAPGTSHVATRPKKHTCERRICPSLSRPFAAGPASSLFVVVQSVLDVIRIPGTTVVPGSLSSVFPLLFCSFCRLVL